MCEVSRSSVSSRASQSDSPLLGCPKCAKSADTVMGQPGSQSIAFMRYATIGSLGDDNLCELPNTASLSPSSCLPSAFHGGTYGHLVIGQLNRFVTSGESTCHSRCHEK